MYEMIYASSARRLYDPMELGHMLEGARRNNAALSVSGILLYDAGSFLQVLEGEQDVVMRLYEKIARDARHERVQVLRQGPVATRSFSSWSMGFVALDPQLRKAFPDRHALSSNGSLAEHPTAVLELLDRFRAGQWRSYILG